MKAVVITDSHGKVDYILKVLEIEKPDALFFAGDHSEDCIETGYIYEELKYYMVKGNTDMEDYHTPEIVVEEIEGVKIFLTHGHLFRVKHGYGLLENHAVRAGADLVIFGHTHVPYKEEVHGILYFNPGAMKDRHYGVVEISKGSVNAEFRALI